MTGNFTTLLQASHGLPDRQTGRTGRHLNFSQRCYSIALPQPQRRDVSTFDLKGRVLPTNLKEVLLARPQLPGNYDQCQLSRTMMMLMNQIIPAAINTYLPTSNQNEFVACACGVVLCSCIICKCSGRFDGKIQNEKHCAHQMQQ